MHAHFEVRGVLNTWSVRFFRSHFGFMQIFAFPPRMGVAALVRTFWKV